MFDFYTSHNFCLFPCNVDKSPQVVSWRATSEHITPQKAQDLADKGQYIGAWLPQDHVVIDIDANHADKPSGFEPWEELTSSLGLCQEDLLTLTVKTGSGGNHLYFRLPPDVDYRNLSQKSIATSVDVRTHAGYVIAAGTNGYHVQEDRPIAMLPQALVGVLERKTANEARQVRPAKPLPPELLAKVLSKLDPQEFSTNDDWQEFIIACIAAAGNDPAVLSLLEAWSKSDPAYCDDESVGKRIATFEPSGGITAGTFIYILRRSKSITKYMVDQVRTHIGAQFDFNFDFAQDFELPFPVDMSLLHEHRNLMSAFYYKFNQAAAVSLITELCRDNMFYAEDERRFYYYGDPKWHESQGILNVIFAILLHAGQRFYTDHSSGEDTDATEVFSAYVGYIGSITALQKIEVALKQHPSFVRTNVPWDSPQLEATLTLADCVMDFSTPGEVVFRSGSREEYRRLYIDLKKEDFTNKQLPENFRAFLKDVFPDDETRKTATYALSTMLSGTGKFRKFQIWNGSGSNGKSALMDIMTKIIGKERAITYGAEVLLSSRPNNSLTPEIAAFRGALVAFASETEESKRVSQGMIKHLTGDEEMTANPKYQGMITFKTTFQLVLSTNYLPSFSAHDNAFVNRLLILPFYTTFYQNEEQKESGKRTGSRYFIPARDISTIKEGILKEKAQVLYYLARRYQELDITIPESPQCLEAKEHYIQDNNGIVDFIDETVEFDDTKDWFTPTKDIVDFYNEDQNTRYSAKYILMRIKEVLPLAQKTTRRIDGKLHRGLSHIRLKFGTYPEGVFPYGNFTKQELESLKIENTEY